MYILADESTPLFWHSCFPLRFVVLSSLLLTKVVFVGCVYVSPEICPRPYLRVVSTPRSIPQMQQIPSFKQALLDFVKLCKGTPHRRLSVLLHSVSSHSQSKASWHFFYLQKYLTLQRITLRISQSFSPFLPWADFGNLNVSKDFSFQNCTYSSSQTKANNRSTVNSRLWKGRWCSWRILPEATYPSSSRWGSVLSWERINSEGPQGPSYISLKHTYRYGFS